GVHAVLTGKHLPIPYGTLPVSQDEHALALEKVRYVGEPVAAVAAVDEETAEEALSLIEIAYEELPSAVGLDAALQTGAPLIHEEQGDNICSHERVEKGNVEQGFAESDE